MVPCWNVFWLNRNPIGPITHTAYSVQWPNGTARPWRSSPATIFIRPAVSP